MKIKEILTAFWRYSKAYDGDISCKRSEQRDGYTFFTIDTDKTEYLAAVNDNAEKKLVFFSVAGSNEWQTADKMVAIVGEDGLPKIKEGDDPAKTPVELAAESGKSIATVYKLAKQFGRLPTVEELQTDRKSPGRPRKYW
ncbi:MAG: hypothetical protein LUD29_05370 [Clostridia bacterium]|nr:hypothetical protein [Clostridia bacterium]